VSAPHITGGVEAPNSCSFAQQRPHWDPGDVCFRALPKLASAAAARRREPFLPSIEFTSRPFLAATPLRYCIRRFWPEEFDEPADFALSVRWGDRLRTCAHRFGGEEEMIVQPSFPVVFATILTFIAGFVDAAAYIELHHLYVSFMSGNSTHLGMALAVGILPNILAVATIIVAFVAGTAFGTWIADRHAPTTVLGAEVVLFLASIGLAANAYVQMSLTLVAVAMGMQNVLHQTVAGVDVGRGFITGALFSLGQSIARLSHDRGAIARIASSMLSWSAFVAGACVGAFALTLVGLTACLVAATTVVLAMLAALLARWL
jgi:uncharacterized membrane protein YoaK (UPF0700 family)